MHVKDPLIFTFLGIEACIRKLLLQIIKLGVEKTMVRKKKI
jgi:hypothetical protein